MNVQELVAELLGVSEHEVLEMMRHVDQDVAVLEREVRLAHQPQWPFEYNVGEVVHLETNADEIKGLEEVLDGRREEGEDLSDEDRANATKELETLRDTNKHVVYIGERGQIGYLPGNVANALGWGR